ncbi:MAG: hypothetical protein LIP01_01240, partial [Tannerellaceae bacterium]|nr:hypothetical protein [Tannerellaceae bacterium]
MTKHLHYIYRLVLIITTLCITACKDEEYFSNQCFNYFFDFIEEIILLINYEQKENEYVFTFENGESVSLPAKTIKEIRIDHT